MSLIYHTEPPTQGKVLIKTNFGDIDIELWPKEAPLACRNFIQLALEGYYDHTNVVRVVKGFMVQMGDPTGTGSGGSSIWGRPFKDEIHGRIKFNHRGQVAMANSNKPNSNQSQFFITLDNCDWLHGKHTIFGKVTGSTMFNVLRMGDVEVDDAEKPLDSIVIKKMEVLANPFDDITPRAIQKKEVELATTQKQESKSKLKSVKNTKLLSFMQDSDDENNGNDEDDSENEVVVKVKSIHDLKKKKKSAVVQQDDNKIANIPSETKPLATSVTTAKRPREEVDELPFNATKRSVASEDTNNNEDDEDDAKVFDRKMRQQIMQKMSTFDAAKKRDEDEPNPASSTTNRLTKNTSQNKPMEDDDVILDKNSLQEIVEDTMKQNQMKQSHQEFYKLRQQLLQSKRAIHVLTGSEKTKQDEEQAFQELISPLEQRRLKYQKRKNDYGDRAAETMAKLTKFTNSLRQTKQEHQQDKNDDTPKAVESYHGQVLESDEDEKIGSKRRTQSDSDEDDGDGEGLQKNWFVGKLKCKKHIDHQYRNQSTLPGALGNSNVTHGYGADGRNMDDYVVVDPRKK